MVRPFPAPPDPARPTRQRRPARPLGRRANTCSRVTPPG
jgi:hypothetical protein